MKNAASISQIIIELVYKDEMLYNVPSSGNTSLSIALQVAISIVVCTCPWEASSKRISVQSLQDHFIVDYVIIDTMPCNYLPDKVSTTSGQDTCGRLDAQLLQYQNRTSVQKSAVAIHGFCTK